jgi:hypothetical protein
MIDAKYLVEEILNVDGLEWKFEEVYRCVIEFTVEAKEKNNQYGYFALSYLFIERLNVWR